jgi:hypothetical protein
MKLILVALVSIMTNGACAEVADPCLVCQDGATAGADFAPFAADGVNATCGYMIDAIKNFGVETDECMAGGESIKSLCCLTNHCIACPDGITAGDDFAPFAEGGYYNGSCKEIVESYIFFGAGSDDCLINKNWDEALCCPNRPTNPCDICPNGLTVPDDFYPPDDWQTCKQNVDTLMLIESDSVICSEWGPLYKFACCSKTSTDVTTTAGIATTTTLIDGATTSTVASTFTSNATISSPCLVCQDGATAGDDFAPFAADGVNSTCVDLIEEIKGFDAESDGCMIGGEEVKSSCCPPPLENPCIACPNGITAGNDFAPYAEGGYLVSCKELIDFYGDFDVESDECLEKNWDEALCCPTTPVNPCIICPDGLIAPEDFFPFRDSQTCKGNIDTGKLIETESKACKEWGPYYEILCCPDMTITTSTNVEGSSTAATTASTATTTTSTTDATTSMDSTSSDATSTFATGNSELTPTTATVIPSTESIPSGDVTVFGLRVFAFTMSVSVLSSITIV